VLLAEEYEVRDLNSKMTSNKPFYLGSVTFKSVNELLCLCERCEGRNHVLVVVEGLFFCDLLPFRYWNGEVRHDRLRACQSGLINQKVYV